MTLQTKALGRNGEELAVTYLQKKGYRILERNYRNVLGEMDIIALEKDTICFVEVKTRKGARFGSPLEAISRQKQFKLAQVALSYLKSRHKLDKKTRFDIITVIPRASQDPAVELIRNVFEVGDFGF